MATKLPFFDVASFRHNKDQIRQLSENHEQEWQEVASIKFWQHVAARQAIGYSSVKEIFARFKIVPRFQKFDNLFQEALSAKLLRKVNTRTAVEFASSITTKLQKIDETCVEVDPDDSSKQIADKITNKRRDVLAAEFAKINANSVECIFPRCADWKIQDIFMALKDTERKNWSKRMYENVLYSAIFQRYFKDDYDNLSDQKINEFLPARIENEVRSDFILISDHSPFLICEYGEEEYVSNHEKLIKLLETMQQVLKNRRERSVYCTSDIYGVLCCKDKLALFYMDYDSEDENYPCYFLAANETDLQRRHYSSKILVLL